MKSNIAYYEYSFKSCGGTWKYCDGQCSKCAMTGTITSNSTQFNQNNNRYSNTTGSKYTELEVGQHGKTSYTY